GADSPSSSPTPSRGSTANLSPTQPKLHQHPVAPLPPNPNVLVVEDHRASADALCQILQRKGCTVSVARTLAHANALLAEKSFDSVLLDLMLPDGNGMDILRRFAAERNESRIIVTTASNNPDHLREAAELQPRRVLRKPLQLIDLLGAMGMM